MGVMNVTMKCPKCQTVAIGQIAGKVGFSGPRGGPLVTPTPEQRYHFVCKEPNCGRVWYPGASEIDSTVVDQDGSGLSASASAPTSVA
jgi:hypothetical protein